MQIKTGKITRTQKCVIYGCEGVGKSTFASKFPKPLFADLEGGTAHLAVPRISDLNTWETLLSCIDELIADKQGFKTFVLDTADWAERLCIEFLCKKYKKTGLEDFNYGKGYQYLAEEYARMLANLSKLQNSGMHVLVLAHSTIKKLELPEENGTYDRYELKCSRGVSPLIKEWADGLLFANYRTYIQSSASGKGKAVGGKERVLYTEHTSFCDAKNRWGLSGVLPLSFDSLKDIFSTEFSSLEEHEDKTSGNLEISDSPKADMALLEAAMEFSAISPDELNDYLRGNNPKRNALIKSNQTYKDLSESLLAKIAEEKNWEKVEAYISERRAK